jgi:uncharacterized protein (DUF4415 family)
MNRKKENIVRRSADELRALREAGQTSSDWTRAAQQQVPSGADPDDALEPVDWSTTELPLPKRKQHMNLRIDADVLDFFRSQGRGYQTRINAVLRSYVEQMRGRDHGK